jgi:protein kinase A
VQGGELFSVVHAGQNKGLPEKDAQFYCACVLEGLGHMHQRSICYRDLKPENVLVDSKGYCVIVDLGFCKIVVDKTYTLCGTPEYLAPEVIMSKGHDKAVDYWSFGVLIYETLAGYSPFYISGTDQVSLFRRIVMVKYAFPPNDRIGEEAQDLIQKLLVRRQATRLGNLARGHLDVRDHPWFKKSIDFRKLLKKEMKTPWVPLITDPLDSSHFDDYSSAERQQRPGKPLSREEQESFKNF